MNISNLDKTYCREFNADTLEIAMRTESLNVFYSHQHTLFDINLQFPRYSITALIGASGSGKSTFLRSLNRMNDHIATVTGKIMYRGLNINSTNVDLYETRKQIGMVFQRPNPFAKSIRENVIFAPKQHGVHHKAALDKIVTSSLKRAALYDEVHDELDKNALSLSGGQAQRLCIARAIAMNPDILLLDEPTSALDPISTAKLEATLTELKKQFTIVIVTHNMQQAARISDYTAFFHNGRVVEFDKTAHIFTNPKIKLTDDYISGNFG